MLNTAARRAPIDSCTVQAEGVLMNILFMSQPETLHPLYEEFCGSIPGSHTVTLFDQALPVRSQFDGVDVVVEVGGSVATSEHLDAGADAAVRLWQILGTGLDHVDVAGFVRRGICMANTPGQFSAIALAEHALFLMLLFAKRFAESQESLRAGELYRPLNSELHGRTLGLIGFGASGRELARRARAFGMSILAYDVVVVPMAEQVAIGVTCTDTAEGLDDILREADYLSVHAPLTSTSRHLIDARALALTRPSAVLINVARGEIVDEAALVVALRTGRLAGAGLDVFAREPLPPDDPLLTVPGVIATPHVAGVTDGTVRRRVGAAGRQHRSA